MKKQNIIIILMVAVIVVVVGCVFLFSGKKSGQDNNVPFQEQNQNIEKTSIASLTIGNWVSVVAEKIDGSYTASMIMACDSRDSCSNNDRTPPSGGTVPTGEAPTGTPGTDAMPSGTAPIGKKDGNMENKSMLSGTITEINADAMVLSLDTGETATVLISDSTRINKR